MFDDSNNGPHHDDINAKINSLGAKCTIALERAPSTGRFHYHVFAQHPTGFSTRSQKHFDVVTYHPNIKLIVSRPRETWDYVTKGGDIKINEVERPEKKSGPRVKTDEVFAASLAQPSYDGMLKTIEAGAPRFFVTSYNNIRQCAKDRFPKEPDALYHHPPDAPFDTTPWPELDDWVSKYITDDGSLNSESELSGTPSLYSGSSADTCSVVSGYSERLGLEASPQQARGTEIQQVDADRYATNSARECSSLNALQSRPKSLILWGPTRTGKTCWARSLGRHAHHANVVNMALLSTQSQYAVFDDISGGLRKLDYKAWLGGQLHFSVTDKYMKKKTITWGKPCIYIANENPFDTERWADLEWLAANTEIVHIDRPMY